MLLHNYVNIIFINTSKKSKSSAVSQHTDTSKNIKAALSCCYTKGIPQQIQLSMYILREHHSYFECSEGSPHLSMNIPKEQMDTRY